jgi:hypothetical protein
MSPEGTKRVFGMISWHIFNLPECEDEVAARKLRAKVKQWTLKKMAELFRVWKKKLWKNYLKKK